ncbi:MAG: helix-turn-helix domain-containing protein [Phycisphaerae bacterium]|nr:helix-turn-helix domain-containing protein [Phycisphaerae bacterium]
MHHPDKHTEVEINYFQQGTLTYMFWGERVTVEAGKPALFWAAVPHQIVDYHNISSYIVITLPLPWLLAWNLPEVFVQKILQGHLIQECIINPLCADRLLFEQWHQDLNCKSSSYHEIVLLEIKARLLRFGGNLERQQDQPAVNATSCSARHTGAQSFGKVESMARFIAQFYTNRISVQDIAGSVGLHPDYAADIFKKTFGITLNNFVIQHRIHHAQHLLVTSSKKILEIAFESGFHSLSRFNASFKLLCNCTPREYRTLHQLPNMVQEAR